MGLRRSTPLLGDVIDVQQRGGVLRYYFDGMLRMNGRGLGQLGPDFLPVVGTQIAAGDNAFGGLLNRCAVFQRHAPDFPVANRCSRNAKGF